MRNTLQKRTRFLSRVSFFYTHEHILVVLEQSKSIIVTALKFWRYHANNSITVSWEMIGDNDKISGREV